MILKNKKLLILTSLLTLLPIPLGLLLWDKFPETMTVHWSITGQADGFASVPFAVFVPPLLLLAVHWICILATSLDKGNKNRNQKLQKIVLGNSPHRQPKLLRHVRPGAGLGIFSCSLDGDPHGHSLCPHRQLHAQDPDELHHGHQSMVGLHQ